MQVKLDKISEWTTTGFKLNNGAYQYAPINAKIILHEEKTNLLSGAAAMTARATVSFG